jgi:DNA-binding CsgD family transcriptional regulator
VQRLAGLELDLHAPGLGVLVHAGIIGMAARSRYVDSTEDFSRVRLDPALGETPLLERTSELAELDRLLTAVPAGGGVALIEGPAGIGKTALLRELRASAADAGLAVLAARSGELECEFAFGVVRQLLEPAIARFDDAEREVVLSGAAGLARPVLAGPAAPEAAPGGASTEATLHGLYWLVANLAERRSLVLLIDDAHWADVPSLDFLEYLSHRIDGVSVLVALAARSDEPGVAPKRVHAIAEHGTVLRPAPLSPEAVRTLAREQLGPQAGDDVCEACHPASGGNPFLLGELLTALRERIAHSPALSASDVPAIEARGVAALVAGRLARIGGAAAQLAAALAVFGDGTELQLLAALADVDVDTAGKVADALAAATIVRGDRPLAFVHPLVRAAVYRQLGAGERSRLHKRAARLLAGNGASPETIARQLLATEAGTDAWVVATLRAAADTSIGRGSPQIAAVYLRRALDEPPSADALAGVLAELGTAEVLAGDPSGIAHLQQALEVAAPGRSRANLARVLAQGLIPVGRLDEAVDVLDAAIAQLPPDDRELALELEADAASAGRLGRSTYARTVERLRRFDGHLGGETAAERLLLANLAAQQLIDGTAAEAAALARRAFEGGLVTDPTSASITVTDALFAAVIADDFELAGQFCDAALAVARGRGSLNDVGLNLMFRSHLAYRQGRIADAETDARAALEVALEGRYMIAMTATGFLIDALIERGELDAAADALAQVGGDGEIPDMLPTDALLYRRAQLYIARGDVDRGLADLELLGERELGYLGSNPSVYPYRSSAAIVLAQRGEHDRAQELAAEELELARAWGSSRSIGIAQRALGLLEDSGFEHLRDAVATLEASGARLEHARALVDLGAALRRAGERTEAREQLAAGMDLAHRCGATALTARARDELIVAGARPRRMAQSGVDSLTASERRIAQMAATGMANKEIAQALFLTTRTVEMHLGNAYRKLNISSRKELDPEQFG